MAEPASVDGGGGQNFEHAEERANVSDSTVVSQEKAKNCRHFSALKYCSYGDSCKFVHSGSSFSIVPVITDESERRRLAWLHARHTNLTGSDVKLVIPMKSADGKKKWSKNRNGSRAASFCRWLVAVFGHSVLSSGTGKTLLRSTFLNSLEL
jgi:hypothetical protein